MNNRKKPVEQMLCGLFVNFTRQKAAAGLAVRRRQAMRRVSYPVLHERYSGGGFPQVVGFYLAALAALIASIIMGTTLNRSPQMP